MVIITFSFAQIPTNGLVAWYPFNGNANDESGNGNNGTVNGATLTTDRFGLMNSAYTIDGINCPSQKGIETPYMIDNTGSYSVSIWFQSVDSTKFFQTIFNSLPHNYISCSFNYDGSIPMSSGVGNGNIWIINGSTNYWDLNNQQEWHHLVMVKTIACISYYLDGYLTHSQLITPDINIGIFSLNFGSITISGPVYCYETFKGKIDDLRIYNIALTQSEVTALNAETPCNIQLPVAQNSTICGPGNISLTASGGTNYNWYTVPVGGSAIGTGATFITPYLTVSDTFWVSNVDSCESARIPVIVIVNTIHILQNDTILCAGNNLALSINDQSTLSFNQIWANTYQVNLTNGSLSRPTLLANGLLAAGAKWTGMSDQLTMLVDFNGVQLWQSVRDPGWDHASFMKAIPFDDNSSLLFGTQNGQGTDYFDAVWVKYNNSTGAELSWGFKSVPGSSAGYDIIRLPNKNFVIAGPGYPNNSTYVALYDSLMQNQITQDIFSVGGWNDANLVQTNSEIIALSSNPGVGNLTIRRYTHSLSFISGFNLGARNLKYALCFDDKLYICGEKQVNSITIGFVLCCDLIGNILWENLESTESNVNIMARYLDDFILIATTFTNSGSIVNSKISCIRASDGIHQDTSSLTLFSGQNFMPKGMVIKDNQQAYLTGFIGVPGGIPAITRVDISGNPSNSFLWSTGDTTNSIQISPNQTTLYTVTITSNGYSCVDSATVTISGSSISGTLSYDNVQNTSLCSSKIYLKTLNGAIVDSTLTDINGGFRICSVPNGSYKLTAKVTTPWGGVNAVDALQALKHFVAIQTLSGLKIKAADVNGNNYVNSIDALMIQKRYIGFINSFPIQDWLYSEPEIQISNMESYTVNVKALCAGDCNASYQPPANCFYSCGDTLTDTRDGQDYPTVQIGTQCWMQKNLNLGMMVSGNMYQTDNNYFEKYCYNNLESNCAIYGGLYQWDEMMNYTETVGVQGICPSGWHIPTDNEFCNLLTFLDPTVDCSATILTGTNAGGKLKQTGTTYWNTPNTGASNESGYNGLGAGHHTIYDNFTDLFLDTAFWTSSEFDQTFAQSYALSYNSAGVGPYGHNKLVGFSVRCLKD